MEENQNLNKDPKVVGAMFDGIAHRYDFLNHFLSLGIDKIWRKKLIKRLKSNNPKNVLDIATGTGDLAIQLVKSSVDIKVVGIDISSKMLEVGQQKLSKLGLNDKIELIKADSLSIPFSESTYDGAMVAFGVRNFDDPVKGMTEIHRVLKNGSHLYVLEFSMPSNRLMLMFYRFYFKSILPFFGRIISGHRMAYTYLPDSVTKFPDGNDFITLMKQAGFSECQYRTLSFGIATLYEGKKILIHNL